MKDLTVSVKVPRPRFMENYGSYIREDRETKRVCSRPECENPARLTGGYYLAGNRRVRVWVCTEHKVGNPNQLLPTPAHIKAAFDAEDKFRADRARWARLNAEPEGHVSVKQLASTGFGKALPFDRVANFRWEPVPGALAEKRRKNAAG